MRWSSRIRVAAPAARKALGEPHRRPRLPAVRWFAFARRHIVTVRLPHNCIILPHSEQSIELRCWRYLRDDCRLPHDAYPCSRPSRAGSRHAGGSPGGDSRGFLGAGRSPPGSVHGFGWRLGVSPVIFPSRAAGGSRSIRRARWAQDDGDTAGNATGYNLFSTREGFLGDWRHVLPGAGKFLSGQCPVPLYPRACCSAGQIGGPASTTRRTRWCDGFGFSGSGSGVRGPAAKGLTAGYRRIQRRSGAGCWRGVRERR